MLDTETISQKRRIYLLPNLFTTAGLFAGFYSIVSGMKGNFENSAIALFLAMIMDGLDGRVARITGTESAFGAQYDSLSDVICFGVTPALIAYSWGIQYLGKIGWLSAFFYSAATALRLARFNSEYISQNVDKKFFIGLPCPTAAALIAGMIWISTDFNIQGKTISVIGAIFLIVTAFLMVSNVRYHSFKEIDLKGNVPFFAILIVVLSFLLIAWDPPKVLFVVFLIYVLSGPIFWIYDYVINKL